MALGVQADLRVSTVPISRRQLHSRVSSNFFSLSCVCSTGWQDTLPGRGRAHVSRRTASQGAHSGRLVAGDPDAVLEVDSGLYMRSLLDIGVSGGRKYHRHRHSQPLAGGIFQCCLAHRRGGLLSVLPCLVASGIV